MNCFSLRALEGASKGRVIAHASAVHMANATFKVSAAGRARVLSCRQKNVHAGISGELLGWRVLDSEQGDAQTDTQIDTRRASSGKSWEVLQLQFEKEAIAVTYDPYKYEHFTQVARNEPIHQSPECFMNGKRVWARLP